jgi:hypothetical protein
MIRHDKDQYGMKETYQRLQAILRGAFSGPPTQLKDIPKENGESRAIKRPEAQRKKTKAAKRGS